jgi:signal peptidase I
LHCARPSNGCEAQYSDRVLANRVTYHFRSPHRGEIVVFRVPQTVRKSGCGNGGEAFVKRLIGLPGERVHEDGVAFIWINGRKLNEPYIQAARRGEDRSNRNRTWVVPQHNYFMIGDNRGQSCDSRVWGSVPRGNFIGKVFAIYWPLDRISRKLVAGGLLTTVVALSSAFLARRYRQPHDQA